MYALEYLLKAMIHILIHAKSVWIQDIPMLQTAIRHDANAVDFPGSLQRVLHYLNVPKALDKFVNEDVSFSFHNTMLFH